MKLLERRIRKLEVERSSGIPPPIILEMGSGSEFDSQVAKARETGAPVIVAHHDWAPDRRELVDGIRHMSAIVAALEYCIAMPSRQGRSSMLDDVIQDIQGNSIRPPEVSP